MSFWKHLPLAAVTLLAACSGPDTLDVRPFHLRKVGFTGGGEPLIDGEMKRRLYGAVGIRDQEQRLGQYYTVLWHDDSLGEPVRVVFEYQQASTASKILKKTQDFSGDRRSGKAEFQIIGDDYLKGGRVLTWKCTLLRGDQVVESRQSYLWQ